MHPVSLDAALLRLQLPELVLKEGMSVVARVASRGEGQRGAIVLAGQLLRASLPDEVQQGDTLRLRVAETSAERVVFKLEGSDAPAAHAAAQPQPQAPPPGLAAPPPPMLAPRDADEDGGEGGAGRGPGGGYAGVSLVYDAPALGRLDLRIDRGPDGLVATVTLPAGSYALAHARAESLREALEARTGLTAAVRVAPRREPFDAYA